MDKHSEHSHKLSPSGKLVSCIQRVYCGSDDYLIIKTVNDNKAIYADYYWNGYCDWPCGKLYWEQDDNGDDVFVEDRVYLFYKPLNGPGAGSLALMNGSEYCGDELVVEKIIKECFDDAPMFWKDEIYLDHRLVKYKRDMTQQNPRSYQPHGHNTEFNCEMVVVENIQSDLFKCWKAQDKCRMFVKDWAQNPCHPDHSEWLETKQTRYELYKQGKTMSDNWFIQEKSWDDYKRENVYY